ncbi:unnamed protein product [Lampetra planeri]
MLASAANDVGQTKRRALRGDASHHWAEWLARWSGSVHGAGAHRVKRPWQLGHANRSVRAFVKYDPQARISRFLSAA